MMKIMIPLSSKCRDGCIKSFLNVYNYFLFGGHVTVLSMFAL